MFALCTRASLAASPQPCQGGHGYLQQKGLGFTLWAPEPHLPAYAAGVPLGGLLSGWPSATPQLIFSDLRLDWGASTRQQEILRSEVQTPSSPEFPSL